MDKPKKKERAKKLDQETLAKIFVGQSRSRGDYAQKKRMNVQEEYESYLEATGGNPAIASDMLLYNNAAFRAKFNRLPENRENVDLQVHYDLTANLAKDKRYFEDSERYEKRQLVTTSDPGGLNVIQTSLSDTIVVKSERLGQILQLVAKDEMVRESIDYESALVNLSKLLPLKVDRIDDLLWTEIDTMEHLIRARDEIYPKLMAFTTKRNSNSMNFE